MNWRFIAGSGLAVCVLSLAAGSGFGTLVITEVMSDSLHPAGSANGDWWELTNDGPTDIELGGYSWDDSGAMAGNSVFPEFTIGAGESIVIADEPDDNVAGFKSAWNLAPSVRVISRSDFTGPVNFANLAALGDEVHLFDPDDLLVWKAVFGDSAGGGKSFAWGTSGAALGFSVAGENGAHLAAHNGAGGNGMDVASPGVSVRGAPSTTLVITEVMNASLHPGGSANGDWWELTNRGVSSVDLDDYSWDDEAATAETSVFPDITLAPGESLIVVDEPGANVADFKQAWNLDASDKVLSRDDFAGVGFSGLGESGDEVTLFNADGALITKVVFGDAAGGGKSFGWDTSGTLLGLSTAGENGAFLAEDNGAGGAGMDIGSPAFALFPGGESLTGDLDHDGDVDFDDIDDFVLGLNDPTAYLNQFSVPPAMTGDTDDDGDMDFDDIQGFVGILNGLGATASLRTIPEPGALCLLVMGLASLVGLARRVCQRV